MTPVTHGRLGGIGGETTATALKVRTLLPHPRLLYVAVAGSSVVARDVAVGSYAEVKKVFSSVLIYVVHKMMLTFVLQNTTIAIQALS
ncbi:hypothetical protein CEN44_24090 [Fischerella muscicola CCMEE 5323]|uniref:Uncharacterized protein n=1 Tax=Fischerella muscicola CCMEE 5323 TaxID=2019572 RepID=A0A2N6JWZ1_FISMU|nr:hypothetical protein CEN44_24090 [Fischerella muscicola CCMEE 5323]